MSEPANETLDAPTPSTTDPSAADGLPAAAPAPLPLLDGELPRLAETAFVTPPSPAPAAEPPTITTPLSGADLPTLPDLPTPATHVAPSDPAEAPSLEGDGSTAVSEDGAEPVDGDETGSDTDEASEHPMAHLMMTKASATEASKRAAAIRAEKKAKARKIKIGLVAGLVVVTVTAGPFVGAWVMDGINEAGTSTDEP